jgi:hypothetical protein
MFAVNVIAARILLPPLFSASFCANCEVGYASQQLTKQGPSRHNRSIDSPEAIGLKVRQLKYRLPLRSGRARVSAETRIK